MNKKHYLLFGHDDNFVDGDWQNNLAAALKRHNCIITYRQSRGCIAFYIYHTYNNCSQHIKSADMYICQCSKDIFNEQEHHGSHRLILDSISLEPCICESIIFVKLQNLLDISVEDVLEQVLFNLDDINKNYGH